MDLLTEESANSGQIQELANHVEAAVLMAMIGHVITELKKRDDVDELYTEFQQLGLFKNDAKPDVTTEDKMFSMAVAMAVMILHSNLNKPAATEQPREGHSA
jgi:hypothetical protein